MSNIVTIAGAHLEPVLLNKTATLKKAIAAIEEVIMEPFSQTGASCPQATDCSNLLVPKDALVQINVVPVK